VEREREREKKNKIEVGTIVARRIIRKEMHARINKGITVRLTSMFCKAKKIYLNAFYRCYSIA